MTPRERALRIQYDSAVENGLKFSFETFMAMASDPAVAGELNRQRAIIERHIIADREDVAAQAAAQAAAAVHTGGRVQS